MPTKTLPKKIQVLSRVYTVKRVLQKTLDKEHPNAVVPADCCTKTCMIRIAREVSIEAAWGLLEHELGHAFIYELGLGTKIDSDLEEDICNLLLPNWLGAVRPRL